MTQIERDTLDHEESERENDACQRHSTHPDKDVLKTTSPIFVPSAPNAFPCHTEPSSKTNLQGFWTSHGFEIAAKHRTPALPLLFDDDDDEVEVEHEALFFKDVLPTRPLNCVDTKLAWWWWCAEQDDIAKARLFYVFFFCSKSSFEMTRRRRVNSTRKKEEEGRRHFFFHFWFLNPTPSTFNPNVEDGECCLSFLFFFFTRFFLVSSSAHCWWFRVGEGTRKRDFFLCVPRFVTLCAPTHVVYLFSLALIIIIKIIITISTHIFLSPFVSYVDRARAYYLYTWIK